MEYQSSKQRRAALDDGSGGDGGDARAWRGVMSIRRLLLRMGHGERRGTAPLLWGGSNLMRTAKDEVYRLQSRRR